MWKVSLIVTNQATYHQLCGSPRLYNWRPNRHVPENHEYVETMFLYVQFSILCCDWCVWLGLGIKTTSLGLGKDHVLSLEKQGYELSQRLVKNTWILSEVTNVQCQQFIPASGLLLSFFCLFQLFFWFYSYNFTVMVQFSPAKHLLLASDVTQIPVPCMQVLCLTHSSTTTSPKDLSKLPISALVLKAQSGGTVLANHSSVVPASTTKWRRKHACIYWTMMQYLNIIS